MAAHSSLPSLPAVAPWRLAAFYGGYFLVLGVLTPFWPVFLAAKGMEASAIGLLLTLSVLVRVAAGPAISWLAERSGCYRAPLIVSGFAAVALAVPFFWAEGFVALLVVSASAFFAFSCMIPLAETVTLVYAPVERSYGRIRLWGSLAFIVGAGGGGLLLDGWNAPSADILLALILASLTLAAVAALALPDLRYAPKARGAGALAQLLRRPAFRWMLLAAGFGSASHAVYYGFATLHWQAAGLSNTVIGLLWAEGVLAEIGLFLFAAAAARRFGAVPLMVFAAAAGMLRWVGTGVSEALWVLALLQLLHAATFGALHLGVMQFIARAAPGRAAVAAQGAYAALAGGLALGLGLLAAGALYEHFGPASFHAAAAASALALVSALALGRSWRGTALIEDADRGPSASG